LFGYKGVAFFGFGLKRHVDETAEPWLACRIYRHAERLNLCEGFLGKLCRLVGAAERGRFGIIFGERTHRKLQTSWRRPGHDLSGTPRQRDRLFQ
jgi:hypothetical protein